MTVVGYRAAFASAIDVKLPANQRVLVVSLPMLAALKVVAWSERHTAAPRKDAADLRLILKNYFDAGNQERLYEETPHLLEDSKFDYERAGTWLAGQDAAKALQTDAPMQTAAHEQISNILTEEVDPGRAAFYPELPNPDPSN